jgi:hypothetical protein
VDEMGFFCNCPRERTLALKCQSWPGGKVQKGGLTVLLSVNSDGSNKQVLIAAGK